MALENSFKANFKLWEPLLEGIFLYHLKVKDYCHKGITSLQLEKYILKNKHVFLKIVVLVKLKIS